MMTLGESPTNKSIRILIVEDHEIVRNGLSDLLEQSWTVCGEATNGDDAIVKAQSLRPDVVILDFSMPGKGGVDALVTKQRPVGDLVLAIQRLIGT